jgi:hypothetical protein
MKRQEPPAAATWLLEHLTPVDRDEALAGDLLEDFRSGRTDGWYWRQALAAFAVAWSRYFAQRRSMLLFVLLWSMMAPAWTAIVDRIERQAGLLGPIWRMDAPFSTLSTLGLWLLLHLAFLWAGILVYFAAWAGSRETLRLSSIVRACGVASALFLPIYFGTFVLMNLIEFPGPMVDRRTLTPLGEIADLRLWAMAVRVPYLLTMLLAMWRATRIARASRESGALGDGEFVLPSARQMAAALDPFTLKRFFAFVVGAGLLNALIAGFLVCQLPEAHDPTMRALLERAAAYVAFGALAGIVGAWIYWNNPSSPFRENSPLPFRLFALVCANGWVWVPAVVILCEQVSAAAGLVAMIGAWALAVGLRKATSPLFGAVAVHGADWCAEEPPLFAESLHREPWEAHGYLIALCLYGGGWALVDRSNMTAGVLLASSAFLFAWKRTHARSRAHEGGDEYKRAALRLAGVAAAAVLVTAWALVEGVAHRNEVQALNALLAEREAREAANSAKETAKGGGYVSVILWPYQEKKQIVPPLPERGELLAPGTKQPVVVRFDGAYWYLQPPEEKPGLRAHQAHGTPLAVGIKANNSFPLMMEAHQNLGAPIRLARCSEIEVEVLNQDNRAGTIAMALVLTNSALAGEPNLALGEQPVVSTEPEHFVTKTAPVHEKLRFAVPTRGRIRAFNEITVMLIPDSGHSEVGPRIAIQQFEFVPR